MTWVRKTKKLLEYKRCSHKILLIVLTVLQYVECVKLSSEKMFFNV